MKKIPIPKDVLLILIVFLVSRVLLGLFGVHLDYLALYRNWQYLDVDTLRHALLKGVWYDHTQPPVFNLLLGTVLKIAGDHAGLVFITLLKAITLANTFLILTIGKRLLPDNSWRLPLLASLFYLLSPATLLFENELFYTTFISLLLLIGCLNLLSLSRAINWKNTTGFVLPLFLVAMTRSLYHLAWLILITAVTIFLLRKKSGIRTLVTGSLLVILLTGGWYARSLVLFGSFSSSTWMGMNLARNVFHDAVFKDSTDIAAIEPFSRISAYHAFLLPGDTLRYGPIGTIDLHEELKSDSFINEKDLGYIAISRRYMESCKREIREHPAAYAKNVLQSAIIFFAPATRYSVTEYEARRIMYYDLLYSFNLSHLAKGKQQRRIALTLSAIPKLIIWFFVFAWWAGQLWRTRRLTPLSAFLFLVIGYVFCVSSLFEHYENMRFRYEIEPLFLILAIQALASWLAARKTARSAQEIRRPAA
jgi:hypothetical protein